MIGREERVDSDDQRKVLIIYYCRFHRQIDLLEVLWLANVIFGDSPLTTLLVVA